MSPSTQNSSPFYTTRAISSALGLFESILVTTHAPDSLRPIPSSTIPRSTPWSPPIPNWVKLNADACWKSGVIYRWVGIVARDSASVCIAIRSIEMSATSSTMTEMPTILEDRVLAKYLQFQEMVIEYDALDIIHSINSASLSYAWELIPILSRA